MSPQDIINSNSKLVALPAIISRVNVVMNDPACSAADIDELISQEPALATRLLKIINSPFYDFPSSIDTISMAVAVLGIGQLRDLIIATSLIRHFNRPRNAGIDTETFWCHSITTGLAARTIALDRKLPHAERLFLGGLVHDIGKMIMSQLLPEATTELRLAQDQAGESSERVIFGFTHDELGQCLLQHWHFPEAISVPVRHHHDLQCADKFKTDTAILHIGNVIANNIQTPVSSDDDTLLNPLALKTLAMDEQDIEPWYESVYQTLDSILQTLYYDIAVSRVSPRQPALT